MLDALAIDSLHTALQQQRNHQTAIQAEPQPECERVQARSFHSDLPGSPLRTHAPQTAQSSIDNSFQHLHAVAESRESKFPFIENESEAGEDSEGRQVQVTVSSPFHEVEPDRNRSMAHPTPTQSESGQSDLLRDYRRLAAEHRQCLPQTEKLQKALDAVHRQLEKGTKESVDLLKRLEQLAQSLQMPHPCVEAPPAPGQTANIVAVLHRQVKLIADFSKLAYPTFPPLDVLMGRELVLARPSGPSSTVFMRSHGPPDETTWMWHTDSNTWSASKDDSRASSQKLNGQMKAPVQSPPHDTRASNVRANQRQAPPTSRRNSLTPHQPVLSPIEEGPSLPGSPFRPSMSAAPISSSLLQSIAGHIDWEAVGL